MKKKFMPVVLSISLLSGCASIVSKSDYPVSINSNPDGATFVVTNKEGQKVQTGVTPSSVTLKASSGYFKGETYTIEIKKDGYTTKTYTLTSGVDGWYWGNILFGGLIGMLIVDPLTGAMYTLPTGVNVPLDAQSASADSGKGLTIANINTLTKKQISQLKRIQ